MSVFLLASLPNSRIKPRAATTAAQTRQVTIDDYGQPLVEVAPANDNRTYIILQNFVSTPFFYVYANNSTTNPSVVARFGLPGDIVFFSGALYEKQDTGLSTNWSLVTIETVGEKVFGLQNANLESLQSIYAAYDSAVPFSAIIGVDEGRG